MTEIRRPQMVVYEQTLWDRKILDSSTPQGLLYCVFFYNGKHLHLRGGDKHRNLKISQFKLDVVDVDGSKRQCYVFTENGSKNRELKNKILEVSEAGEQQYFHILDLYLSKLPKAAIERDVFYVCSSTVYKPDQPWYTSVPVGRNKLSSMVKKMCSLAGEEEW